MRKPNPKVNHTCKFNATRTEFASCHSTKQCHHTVYLISIQSAERKEGTVLTHSTPLISKPNISISVILWTVTRSNPFDIREGFITQHQFRYIVSAWWVLGEQFPNPMQIKKSLHCIHTYSVQIQWLCVGSVSGRSHFCLHDISKSQLEVYVCEPGKSDLSSVPRTPYNVTTLQHTWSCNICLGSELSLL